jgi:hypothetical protein
MGFEPLLDRMDQKTMLMLLKQCPQFLTLLSNRESTIDVNKTPHEQHEMKRPGYSFERPGRRLRLESSPLFGGFVPTWTTHP